MADIQPWTRECRLRSHRDRAAVNNDLRFRGPRMPEWLDQGIGNDVEEREEREADYRGV
jgi:hypothetical protein